MRAIGGVLVTLAAGTRGDVDPVSNKQAEILLVSLLRNSFHAGRERKSTLEMLILLVPRSSLMNNESEARNRVVFLCSARDKVNAFSGLALDGFELVKKIQSLYKMQSKQEGMKKRKPRLRSLFSNEQKSRQVSHGRH